MTTSMKVLCSDRVPSSTAVAAAASASSSSLPLDAPPSLSSLAICVVDWLVWVFIAYCRRKSNVRQSDVRNENPLFLSLAAATAAASEALLLRLASARTPRSTRSEMRLRRELLTRAVHTESRRLILCRACKGTVFVFTSN